MSIEPKMPSASGFALYFEDYSTFEGRPGIFVEDLYVCEAARGLGVGQQLLARLARIVLEGDHRRLDLMVLNWNPARGFYDRLGFKHSAEWLPYRLSGEALARLAGDALR
jgi:GNAT superfamily N-acetyltransferase